MGATRLFNAASTIASGALLTFASFRVFHLIYEEQDVAYMDEVFHVPQARLYCENQWTEWDPKITTFPGLYLVSYFFLKPLEKWGFENFCSLYALRLTNLLATILNFCLTYKIISLLDQKYKVKSNHYLKLLAAFNIAIFPPLYFFTFLYYTDVWSATFVLLTYYLHLSNGRFKFLAGVMAVLMRQTNIIWIGLLIIDDTWSILCKNIKPVAVQDYKYTVRVLQKAINDYLTLKKNSKSIFTLIVDVIQRTYHNLIICFLFVTFVIVNKSIVLGDKDAHTVTFHAMQNLYFLDFFAYFSWPFLLPEVFSLWKKPQNTFLTVLLIGLCAGLSEVNKLEHPYLLADNRHLAFYLWKRVFGNSTIRRVVVPTYVCSGILLWRLLQKRCHFIFVVSLSCCTFLNLTPQYLFELRYFIIPFIMYRLQFRQSWAVVLETVSFVAINAGVLYLFLNKPFVWLSEPGAKQRFIW